ncbi:MAG: hypothetical protein WAV21_01325 [Minisyncoccia bacterium]
MFVIEVIPLSRGIPPGSLSYRNREKLPPGTLVDIPLRKKRVLGLVTSSEPVIEAKATLKRAGFMLRSSEVKKTGRIPGKLMEAAKEIGTYHATSIGSVLGALLVETLPQEFPTLHSGNGFKKHLTEDTFTKRIALYRKNIIESNTAGKATLLIAPTIAEAKRFVKIFEECKPLLLTGEIRANKRDDILAAAVVSKTLLIATPSFAWLPVEKLGGIILERISAGGYLAPRRPYLDLRYAAEHLAKARDISFTVGDLPLPIGYRKKNDAVLTAEFESTLKIIDTRSEPDEKIPFQAVPARALEEIREVISKGGRAVILTARKGYAPAVICRDCGNIVRDEYGRTLSLVKAGAKPILRSAGGETKKDATALCQTCNSWNLMGLGIGMERVAEEIRAAIPEATIALFSDEELRSSKALTKAQEQAAAPGTISIGTEFMLSHIAIESPFEIAVIASADSLLALPFWRSRERLVRIGLSLRERAMRVLIATRQPEDSVFDAISQPEKATFFEEESELRKNLAYPPFGHLLVFHAEGNRTRADEAAACVEKILAPHKPIRLTDRAVAPSRVRLSMVLKLSEKEWPNVELSQRLSLLPPWITTHIDSESLW